MYGDPVRKNSLSRRCHVRPFITLCLVSVLLLALPGCDRGGDNSVTGMGGSPVALRLQSVTGGASDFDGEEFPFAVNPQGCTEECGEEDLEQPKYVEIMVSVDGGDAETIYNGDYSDSLTVSVPNGDVVLLVLIYNCDCCEAFSGFHEMTLPGDGGEVTVEMEYTEPEYTIRVSKDGDGDGWGHMYAQKYLCREISGEDEGWVPYCVYYLDECDCDDEVYDINPDAPEDCDDEVDNDCDSYRDCDDPDCENDPACNEG
jgi:hypothetical protein